MNSTENRPGRQRRKHLLLISAAIFLITIGTTAWLPKTNEFFSNFSTVLGILGTFLTIFTALPALLFEDVQLPSNTPTPTQPTIPIREQGQQISWMQIEGMTLRTLDADKDRGALIVYTESSLLDSAINLYYGFNSSDSTADKVESVIECRANNGTVYAAIFPSLRPVKYTVRADMQNLQQNVIIYPRQVREINWRKRTNTDTTSHQQPDSSQEQIKGPQWTI